MLLIYFISKLSKGSSTMQNLLLRLNKPKLYNQPVEVTMVTMISKVGKNIFISHALPKTTQETSK